MNSDGDSSDLQTDGTEASTPAQISASSVSLVTRSKVPAGLGYLEYKSYLRRDFFYSCAYCTATEAEAQSVRFTIDHYEPRGAKPELVNEYANLMYACDECNQRKGDRAPPAAARAEGYRFFRPDIDQYADHFRMGLSGVVIDHLTHIGDFTIQALDLNRHMLKRIRDLRQRLSNCDKFVVEGIHALRETHTDALPIHMKANAMRTIREATELAGKFAEEIDELLRNYAKSDLIDEDNEVEARKIERATRLKQMESLYPGSWRAPRKKRSKSNGSR